MTITSKVIARNITPAGVEILTFENRYPRFIHAEFMTHRVLSRNASSSRAIPISKVIEEIMMDTAMPERWGINGSGMQDHGVMTPESAALAQQIWADARNDAIRNVRRMLALPQAPHKQIVNRLLEPFAHIRVVTTSTRWANFFALRDHPDAQPEIRVLAQRMLEAREKSTAGKLNYGEWHLPYVHRFEYESAVASQGENALQDLIKVSVARCARTSYNSFDGRPSTLDDDINLYNKLVVMHPLHASPAEHQATPDELVRYYDTGAKRMTSRWKNPHLHGNLVGVIQFRKTLPQENISTYNGLEDPEIFY